MQTSFQARRIRFGHFEVDLRSRELRKHGTKIRLQDQPFQVLAILLERPGDLITRDELRSRLWPQDTFVDFDVGLNTAIKKLRDALNEKAGVPRYIETLPRRGYRFIFPVENDAPLAPPPVLEAGPQIPPIERTPVQQSAEGKGLVPKLWASAFVFVGVIAVMLGLDTGGLRQRLIYWSGPPRIRSVAVLPLENLTGDPAQEYFSDGMTDALITDLAKIQMLRVISRTSVMRYKESHKPLAEIAHELNVDGVVEGSVARSANRVRITAQLIQVANERHVWAESYERDLQDVLGLQDEVARAIAGQVQAKVSPEEQMRLQAARPVNPAAYDDYLKGRFFLNQWSDAGFRQAQQYFQQSIGLDPGYALAYLGLAETYGAMTITGRSPSLEGGLKAENFAKKALEIDDTLAEAHTVLGLNKLQLRCDRSGAEKEMNRAMALNPQNMLALDYHSYYLLEVGRTDEAIAEKKRVLENDPLSLIANAELGLYFGLAGRNDEAVEQLKKTSELDPNYAPAHVRLGWVYANKQQYDRAVVEYKKALAIGRAPGRLGELGDVYARWGKRQEAQKVIDELKQMSKHRYVSAMLIARIYARLGETNQAFQWLGKAEPGGDTTISDPGFDNLRPDARFIALERRLKPNASCPAF
ncbi:MAG TPA: winged helix-turn-helix domain-containing protein [Terriglobia bacterium]|nr:winged helix-turn-helix domain-containing protein [Terriglobia bacterium]